MSLDYDDLNAACMGVFGNDVAGGDPAIIFMPKVGGSYLIVGVFDRAYLDALPMGGANGQEGQRIGSAGSLANRKPVLGLQVDQLPVEPTSKDQVQIGTDLYLVREYRPDGHGWALLYLSKSAA